MMPLSSQGLYFHLGMNADDDGFCEHFTIMRMVEAKPDDLKILQAKGFIQIFDERVLVIRDWTENNYLRNDRYTPSKYMEIYKDEIKRLTSGIPSVASGKVRLGKDRIGEVTSSDESEVKEKSLIPEIIKLFEEVNPACKKMYGNKTQRAACQNLLDEYGFEEVSKFISWLPRTNKIPYIPQAETPDQLWKKWQAIKDAIAKKKNELNAGQNKYPKI